MPCNELVPAQASALVPHADGCGWRWPPILPGSRAPPETRPTPICAVISRGAPSPATSADIGDLGEEHVHRGSTGLR